MLHAFVEQESRPRFVGPTTNAAGGYATKVYPSVSGKHQTVVTGVVGYTDSTSGTFSVTR